MCGAGGVGEGEGEGKPAGAVSTEIEHDEGGDVPNQPASGT